MVINSKQELEIALKRADELWDIADPNTPEGAELELLTAEIEAYECKLLNDERTWDSYIKAKPADDFPFRGSQTQLDRDDFN